MAWGKSSSASSWGSIRSVPNALTIAEALALATRYWDANDKARCRGPNMMPIRAGICADILGRSHKLASLGPGDGAKLLVGLKERGLARSSVANYYAAGRRMLALAGCSCVTWPKAPPPSRQLRPAIQEDLIAGTLSRLRQAGHEDTARFVELMRDTGLRADVEALRGDWQADNGRLFVAGGKGGHQRAVPYVGPEREALRGVTYETHLRRIKEASNGALLPHDLRRFFVTRAYERSGKDLRMAQALAGHASPGTTAGYIGVDWDRMKEAVL